MYSRVTLLEIDTLRVDVDDVVARFEEEILPRVRELPGFEGVAVMVWRLSGEGPRYLVKEFSRPRVGV